MSKKINKKQVDGKADQAENINAETLKTNLSGLSGGKKKVRSIDELLGRRENPYSQGTVEEYEAKLKNMPTTDLERHATQMGSLPNANRRILISRLVDKYRKQSSPYFNTNVVSTVEPKNPNCLNDLLKHVK